MSIKVSSTAGLNFMQKQAISRGDIQWELVKSQGWQCCLNCEAFSKVQSICTLNGRNQTPPPQVILLGCKDYTDDIPF